MPKRPVTICSSVTSITPEQKIGCAPAGSPDVLGDRWPALLNAMRDYKQKIADDFSALAYRCVSDGIIRFDDRRRLAKAAHRAGIRPFDAQILIACAIRQHALDLDDTAGRARPRATAATAPRRWRWLALMLVLATALDVLLIWKWLS